MLNDKELSNTIANCQRASNSLSVAMSWLMMLEERASDKKRRWN
jgi:hypothetical protein